MTSMDRMPVPTVGVDPGSRYCGIVARFGEELLHVRVLDRDKLLPDLDAGAGPIGDIDRAAWVRAVLAEVDVARLAIAGRDIGPGIVGVEDVTAPHPHGGLRDAKARVINPRFLIVTAVVVGHVEERFDAITVRPNKAGAGPDYAYPEGIRRRRRNLGGPSDHARAAWDVAGVAEATYRLTRRTPRNA
jgi:hypothetical protein